MSNPRLLIVEDDGMQREITAVLARRSQLFSKVQECSGIPEALEIFAATESPRKLPEVILCDLRFPGADAADLIKALQAKEATKSIPIAVFTAAAAPGDRERILAAGAADFHEKPFGLLEMGNILRDLARRGVAARSGR